MTKRIIIADTNIIINLCIGSIFIFLCELDDFEFIVTKEVEDEIKCGRAGSLRGVKDQFYTMYNQEKLTICELDVEQIKLFEILRDDHSIGLGEASAIAFCFDNDESFFASDDNTALAIAEETLGSKNRTIRLVNILDYLLKKGLKTNGEISEINEILSKEN